MANTAPTEDHTFKPYKEKKGEEYMSEGQIEHFASILNAWKTELMSEVDRTVDHMKDEAANFPDPADRATQEEEFCEDIPEIGKTVVALDYINDELRPSETEVRIVRSTTSHTISTRTTPQDLEKLSDEDLENMTVYYLEPEVYPTASILIDHTFPEKGMFAGIVTVTLEDQKHVSVFPFSVGEGRPIGFFSTILPGMVIVGLAGFFYMRSRKKPEDSAAS